MHSNLSIPRARMITMSYEGDSIFWVEVEKIVPNPFQPRREFDEAKLKELAESIRMYGILQPLTVTRREVVSEDGAFKTEYELVAGERRLRASKLSGLTQVPVIIRTGEESELMKLELAIIENLQREDLNSVDRGLAFKQLAEQFKLSHSQVAKKVGRSREYVSNSIRLLLLPDHMLEALKMGDMSEGHGRTLLMLNDRQEEQDVLFREILLKKLSVREVEKLARKVATDKVRKHAWKDTDPELIAIEKQFSNSLGTRVQIAKTDYGGKLTIDYFSPEDLQKLLKLVRGEEGDQPGESAAPAATSTTTVQSLAAATPLAATMPDPAAAAVEREMTEIRAQAAKEREAERLVHVDERESLLEEQAAKLDLGSPAAPDNLSEQTFHTSQLTESQLRTGMNQPIPEIPTNIHVDRESTPEVLQENSVPTPDQPEIAAVETPAAVSDESDSEGDLYSMKNFSI